MSEKTTHRARVAALSRSRSINDPALVGARADLAVSNTVAEGERNSRDPLVVAEVQRRLDEAPPLDAQQLAALTLLATVGGAS